MKEERPTPLVEDIEGTRKKLQQWFSHRLDADVTIPKLSIPAEIPLTETLINVLLNSAALNLAK